MGICNSANKEKKRATVDFSEPVVTKPTQTLQKSKKAFNPNCMIKGEQGSTIFRKINDISNSQVIIDNCVNCSIIILDISAAVTVEKCKNCLIFIGPCQSSVFVRNSENLKMISCSQQFRCSTNSACQFSLYSMTKPAIEECRDVSFSCFNFDYPKLKDLMEQAGLSRWANNWSEVNNFDGSTFTLFDSCKNSELVEGFHKQINDPDIVESNFYPIPFTHGRNINLQEYVCCLIFYSKEYENDKLLELCGEKLMTHLNCLLVKTTSLDSSKENYNEIIQTYTLPKNNYIALLIATESEVNYDSIQEYMSSEIEGKICFFSENLELKSKIFEE